MSRWAISCPLGDPSDFDYFISRQRSRIPRDPAYTPTVLCNLILLIFHNGYRCMHLLGARWTAFCLICPMDAALTLIQSARSGIAVSDPSTLTLRSPTKPGRMFAWSETTEAVNGLWYAMNCFWMNHPTADEIALRKVTQHRIAQRLGLRVPETLVTNGPNEARAFLARHDATGVIRKAFRNISGAPRETMKVGPTEIAQLDSVRFAPVIFQEYIPLALDLRVTCVDGEMFATAFRSDPQYEVDYRTGIGSAEVFPYTLPDDVATKLQALMDHFGLKYGAVDFRVTPQGEHGIL